MRLVAIAVLAVPTLVPLGCGHDSTEAAPSFEGSFAREEREVLGTKLSWCPAGTFVVGSPPSEPERRPDETQKEVTYLVSIGPIRGVELPLFFLSATTLPGTRISTIEAR